jgi:hypothetical protein
MIRYLPLTRGRVLALAIGVPLILAIIGWTGFNWVALAGQGSYHVALNLPLTGNTAGLSVDSANLTVGQVAGSHRILVTGTAHYSLVRSRLTWHRTSSGVTVSSGCRLPAGVCSDDFSVTVPAGARAQLSDGSGDMTLRGLTGYVSAGSGSGNINASGLPRSAELQAGSGDIVGTSLSGPRLTVHDGSGNITINGLTSGQVLATDGSGDVNLTFTAIPASVNISDNSGNVTLVLPPGNTLYNVIANTSSGNRNVHVPNSTASHRIITVTDGSGDITITR